MLGEKIGTERGQVTTRRILPGSRVETSFATEGTLLGVSCRDIGTYTSHTRDDGTLYGEGQGLILGDGGEMATWVGQGVGRLRPDGSVSFRGAVYYSSSTPTFSKLNAIAGVYEHEIDAEGQTTNTLYEWK